MKINMKNLIKILLVLLLTIGLIWYLNVNADWINWLNNVQWLKENIKNNSITWINATWNIWNDIQTVWLSILTIIKYIVSGLLVIFMVYVWIQMILSMWSDEEQLSSAKRQIWYAMIWLIFINIPWTIYNMFLSKKWAIDGSIFGTWSSQVADNDNNIFIDTLLFSNTFNWGLINFLEIVIFSIAVFVIIMSGIKIILSAWKDEDMTEAKNKIMWSLVWLIFIWFIESWQRFVYSWNISDWANIFETFTNLILFFAWPVAIFFLTLAWYYYITSNWDEEKVKKAKSIIINTLIATIILLASNAFLKDLMTL